MNKHEKLAVVIAAITIFTALLVGTLIVNHALHTQPPENTTFQLLLWRITT